MVYKHTQIGIVDNTGVKTVKVLQVYNYSQAKVGDHLLTVIRRKKRLKTFVKKKINVSFLIARRTPIFRSRGFYYLKLLTNKAVLLAADGEKILGTRHSAFLTLESKKRAFTQLLRTCRVLV